MRRGSAIGARLIFRGMTPAKLEVGPLARAAVSLDRRLIVLERAPAAQGVVIRVYGTHAEAIADTEPAPGMVVLRIVTGVL